MSATVNETVAGIFLSAEEVNRAVEELKRAGFRDEEIGVIPGQAEGGDDPGVRSETGVTIGTGAGAGLLTGAALGGLAGAVPGMIAGAAAGGLLGALIDLGIPEDAAGFYRDEHEAGRTVVLVRSAGRSAEAADLLRGAGAKEVRLSAASAGPER